MPRRRQARIVLALALVGALAPLASAQTQAYVYTGQAQAQTQVDSTHTATFSITVDAGTTLLFGGGKLTMKRGSAASAAVTLSVYNGTSATGPVLGSVTLQSSAFTQSFSQVLFQLSPPLTLYPGNYFVTVTSPAANQQSSAYFIKGYATSQVSTDGTTAAPGTTTTTAAGLYVVKAAPATVTAGSAMKYTFQLGNSGTANINSGTVVTMQDQLPAGVSATSTAPGTGVSSVSCTPLNTAGALLTCSISLSAQLKAATDAVNGAAFSINVVAPPSAGTYVNYAAVSPSGSSTGIPEPDTCTLTYCSQASTTVSAAPTPGLQLTKTCPAEALAGAQLTCTLTFKNVGTATLAAGTAIRLLDDVPGGSPAYVAGSATPVSNLTSVSCNSATNPLQCTATNSVALAVGSSAAFTIKLTASTTAGTFTNYASISATGTSAPPVPGAACTAAYCASATFDVTPVRAPELALTKSAPTSALIGGQFQYVLTFKNMGTATLVASVVPLQDQLPAGVSLVSTAAGAGLSAASCTPTSTPGALLSCSAKLAASLAVGASASLTLTVAAPSAPATGLNNFASVSVDGSSPPATPGPSCLPLSACSGAVTDILAPALSLAKSGAETAVAGAPYTYSLVITNTGQIDGPAGAAVAVKDVLPAGATFQSAAAGPGTASASCSGAPTLACNVVLGSSGLPVGSTSTFTVTVLMPTTPSTYVNYASVSPNGLAPPPTPSAACTTPECASASTVVTAAPAPSLHLAKSGPDYVVAGASVAYELVVKNTGSAAVAPGTSFQIMDALPAGAVFVSATAGANLVAGPVTCTGSPLVCQVTTDAGGLPVGESAVLTITTTAPSSPSAVTNFASVSSDASAPAPTPGAQCATPNCASLPQTVTAAPKPALELSKTAYLTAVVNGQITYQLTMTNTGSGPLAAGTQVPLLDTLPPSTSYLGANPLTGLASVVCTGSSTLSCTATLSTSLAVGASASFELYVVAPATAGAIVNVASVSADGQAAPPTPTGCALPNCASAQVNVDSVVAPDLVLSKTGPAAVAPNSDAGYAISVTNQGTADLAAGTSFTVQDLPPTGWTYVSAAAGAGLASVTCTGSSSIVCTLVLATPLALGSVVSFELTLRAPGTVGPVVNYAAVSPDGVRSAPTAGPACVEPSCGSASTIVSLPTLSLTKSGPASATIGGQFVYSLAIQNAGSVTLSAGTVPFADLLPAGVKLISASGATCTPVGQPGALLACGATLVSPLAPGASAVVQLTVSAPNTGTSIVNYAAVSVDGTSPPVTPSPACTTTDCSSVTTPIRAPALSLDKAGAASATVGGAVTYVLTITNTGAAAVPAGETVHVFDALPPGASFSAAAVGTGVTGVTCSGLPTLDCGVVLGAGGLAVGSTAQFSITLSMPSSPTTAINKASVSPDGQAPPPDPAACTVATTPACASASTAVTAAPAPVLALEKAGPPTAVVGSSVTYVLTIRNEGTAAVPAGATFNVKDTLPATSVFGTAVGGTNLASSVTCSGSPALSCTVTAGPSGIPIGGTATLSITVSAPTAAASIVNYASVSPDASAAAPTPSTSCTAVNCAQLPQAISAAPAPALELAKTGPASPVAVGAQYTYVLTITNAGTGALAAGTVSVADVLPAGVSLVSTTGGSCAPTGVAGATLACSAAVASPLAPGSSTSLTLTVGAPGVDGVLMNYASVSADGTAAAATPGPLCTTPACASAPATVLAPALTLSKSGPANASVGTTATYVLTVTNSGQIAVPAGRTIAVDDLLPAGAVFQPPAVVGTGLASASCTGTSLLSCAAVVAGGGLAVGATASFSVNVLLPSTPSTVLNYGAVSPDSVAPPPAPGPACTTPQCSSTQTTVSPGAGASAPALKLSKSGPAYAVIGSLVTYQLIVTNTGNGPVPAGTTFSLRDALPAGSVFQSATAGSNLAPGPVSCTGDVLCSLVAGANGIVPGQSASLTITITAPASPVLGYNYASISPDGTAPAPPPGATCSLTRANCAGWSGSFTAAPEPALELVKSAANYAVVGGQYEYSFVIVNVGTGPLPAGPVAVADQLPPDVALVSMSAQSGITSVGCSPAGSPGALLACSATLADNLEPGGYIGFNMIVSAPLLPGAVSNYASISPDGVTPPPTPGSFCTALECASVSTNVQTPALSLFKTAPAYAPIGGTVTFALDFTLGGLGALLGGTALPLLDQLQAGSTFVSAMPGQGVDTVTCTGTSLVSCTAVVTQAGLLPGQTGTIYVTTTVPAGSSLLTNSASITPDGVAAPPQPGAGCVIAACASTSTQPARPRLSLGKTGPATALPGATVQYVMTISNGGPVELLANTPVAVLDQLPAGAVLVGVSPGPGLAAAACSGSTGLVNCTATVAPPGVGPGASAAFYVTVTMPAPFNGPLSNIASVSVDGVTPPVDPASACAKAAGRRRRLHCATCACANCVVDVFDPADRAMKTKAERLLGAVRRAKVQAQQEKLGLLNAVANATETKLAVFDPALRAEVASIVAQVRTAEKTKAAESLGLYDALSNKTLTVLHQASSTKLPLPPSVAAAGGAGTVAASAKLGALANSAAAAMDDMQRAKAADDAGAQRLWAAVANKTATVVSSLSNKKV